uniref:Histone-lysine N-methyltransferase NSD2-2 n=1 Tax=Brachionus koreanus TaxID=1199090 RepID=A0A513TZI4_9BILA|nr:histone-lysine N-methyltransferase NSD2-2 [Brachionus koreanus]
MAAAIASSTSSQNRSICKSNTKSNALDRKNPMHTNPNIRPLNQVPAVAKSTFSCNESKSTRTSESNESQKTRPLFKKHDLVWAKLKNQPWWPCRILNDSNQIGENYVYFVELIGCNSEKDWVSDKNIFEYAGIDSFKRYAQDQVDKATSKSAKEELAERFQLKIATYKREEWDMAIRQADLIRTQNSTNHSQSRSEKRKRENLNLNGKKIDNSSKLKFSNVQNNFSILSVNQESVKKSKQNENRKKIDYNKNIIKSKSESLSDEDDMDEKNCEEDEEDSHATTLTSLLNEQKNLVKRLNKNRSLKTKPDIWTSKILEPCGENELKLKIKLNNAQKRKNDENLTDDELEASPRRRSNSNSSASSRSSSSSSSSTSSCSSSDSSSCSSSDSNGFENLAEMKKNLSPTSSTWSNSTDYELSSSFARNLSDSVVEKINLKKQNARKSSTSLCLSSPTPSLPTPTKRKSNFKQTARKRSSKSLSDQTTIDNLIFDENNLLCSTQNFNESIITNGANGNTSPETYLIDRYKYAVRHIKQGLSVEEACNKYRISKGALLKCLSGGTAPRGKKTRLTESEENEIVEWLIGYKDLKYNDAIHLVFEQVAQKFEMAQRPNPFNNGKPSMDWWYDFLSRHPQIMASKPDWLKRGKVNDQYIRDVQSGHLKCTKFRRALLSAIQYIKSLNDPVSNSILESVTGSSSNSLPTCSLNPSPKAKDNQKAFHSKVKSAKTKNGVHMIKQADENVAQMFHSGTNLENQFSNLPKNTQTNMYSNIMLSNNCINESSNHTNNIHNRNNSNCSSTTVTTNSLDYNDEDLSSVSPISLINSNLNKQDLNLIAKNESLFIDSNGYEKHGNLFNQFVNEKEKLSDKEEVEGEDECMDNLDDNFDDGQNASVTYSTEIFNSELDDNDFKALMDPNMIKKDLTVQSSHLDQTGFLNNQLFNQAKYSNEMILNVRYQEPAHHIDPNSFINIKQQPIAYDNHLLDIESIGHSDILDDRPFFSNIYHSNLNYTDQNLLMRHDNHGIDDNQGLIHGDETLICDSMYPSNYL